MARIRTIKPGFWRHEELSELPEATHLLAAALLNYADDEGYFNANPKLIKAECCPLREPSVSIHDSLTHLSRIGFIRLGTGSDGKRYGHIVTFIEHQRVNRAIDSKIKPLLTSFDDGVSTHTHLSESSLLEGNGKEVEGNEELEKEVDEGARAQPSKYAFSGKVIRVTHDQFAKWGTAYHSLDLFAELTALDDYYMNEGVKDWFVRCSNALASKHRKNVGNGGGGGGSKAPPKRSGYVPMHPGAGG